MCPRTIQRRSPPTVLLAGSVDVSVSQHVELDVIVITLPVLPLLPRSRRARLDVVVVGLQWVIQYDINITGL